MSVYQRVRFYDSVQEEMLLFKAEEGALWHLEEVDWTVDKAMQKWLGPRNQAGFVTGISSLSFVGCFFCGGDGPDFSKRRGMTEKVKTDGEEGCVALIQLILNWGSEWIMN